MQLQLHLPPYILKMLGGLVLAAVFLVLVLSGKNAGQNQAEAEIILKTAQSTQQALSYFYQDQSRFPTAAEFSDQNDMANYLSVFPLPNISSSFCSQSFVYKIVNDNSYSFSFCLPAASGGYRSGWNTLLGSPPQTTVQ